MSSFQLVLSLIKNVTLILSLVFIIGLVEPSIRQRSTLTQGIVYGLLYGLLGILVMLTPMEVGPGFLIDGRSIIATIAGAFGGMIPAVITTVVMSGTRWLLGGQGVPAGILAITLLAVFGSAVHGYHRRRGHDITLSTLVVMSLVGTAVPLILLTSAGGPEMGSMAAGPYLSVVPIGIVLFGTLLLRQRRQFEIEDALQESEERYRSVVTTMTEGVVVRSADGSIQAANQSALRILGASMEELQSWFIHSPGPIYEDGSSFPADRLPALLALRTGQPQFGQVLGFHNADGEITWLLMNSQPLFQSGSTQPYAAVTTFTDITELRSTHQALVQERNLLRTLIDSTPDYIFIKDADGRFMVSNEAHARAVQVSAEGLVGKTAFDVFPEDLASQFHADDMATMESGESQFNLERTTLGDQGNLKTVLTTKVPLHSEDGQVIGLVGISRDITDRKLIEQQEMELAAERERVHVLRRFLADMSHDFRTPLAVVNTSVYLLRKNRDPEYQAAQMAKIEAQAQRMTQLLDELLDMERLDRADSEPLRQLVAVNALVTGVMRKLEEDDAGNHQLQFDPGEEIPLVQGSEAQLQQALEHVMRNATDFTPEGGTITVRTSVLHHQVLIAIEDTGVGIGPEDLSHIFERFYRADQARSTHKGGSGLGLSIARKIVEAHGGDMVVSSTPGKGSVFVVRLPIRAESGETHQSEAEGASAMGARRLG